MKRQQNILRMKSNRELRKHYSKYLLKVDKMGALIIKQRKKANNIGKFTNVVVRIQMC